MNLISKALGFFRPKQVNAVDPAHEQNLALMSRMIRGSYDAARTTDEFKNYWVNADRFDADSAHSRGVRETLVSRSRYEVANNGYADGIAQTYSTDLIGVGPSLRMKSGSTGFNQMVERAWSDWSKCIHLRRKLWCAAHAKHTDGEAIAVMRLNRKLRDKSPILLDVQLYETEQCQTPFIPYEKGIIDGIEFDEFGNPSFFHILPQHPGTSGPREFVLDPERVPADRILHWFKMRRPGQHRGVPECSSTLNLGAARRRWLEATIATAETQADYSLVMKTQMTPDEADAVAPFSTMDIAKRQMAFLPAGWDPYQLEGKLPAATHEAFNKSLINEQGRPKGMPLNKVMCNSADYNYSSGRLDHQTYYAELDVDREDGNDLWLDPLFSVWFDLAIAAYGWLGGDPTQVSQGARLHSWDWPQHRVADIESEANANETKLKSGQAGLHRLYSDAGLDLEDEIPQMAVTFGVSEDEIRLRLLNVILPEAKAAAAPSQAAMNEVAQEAIRVFTRRQSLVATNGGSHAN